MDDRLVREVAAIANDHRSGASALLRRALRVLRRASATGPASLERISPLVCRAQPSMGAVWNAVCEALGADDPVRALDRFERETDLAEEAVTRVAVTLLSTGDGPSRLVSCSASGTVARVFVAIGARRSLRVACAEGRPVYEGRAMAAELRVPVYVVATGDKFVPPGVATVLQLRQGPVAEVWDQPPHGVTVRNPYFERVPLTLVRAVLSDGGVLDAGLVRKRCLEADRPSAFARLTGLLV